MEHLMNILLGFGQTLGAFGTAPQYQYPEMGDRQQDMREIAGDMETVGRRLRNQANKELKQAKHVQIDHCATAQ